MELFFIQSQEHDSLPLAELNAVIESEGFNCNIRQIRSGLVVADSIDSDDFDYVYKRLTERLAYTHQITHVLLKTNLKELDSKIPTFDWNSIIEDTFVVRVKTYDSDSDVVAIERRIGGLILENSKNLKVNLTKPHVTIRIIVYKDDVYLTCEDYILNKKYFQDFKPHKRPFFHPGCMSPKLARCMVNLSRIKEGQLLLDPFCGTGGMLMEGGLIGARVVGTDIDWNMKNGSAINCEYAGVKDFKTYKVDINELKMYELCDAVVTDPPYGISTTTGGRDDLIFKDFLLAIKRNMKDDALLVMASPHFVDIDQFLSEVGFEVLERYEIRMHKSLTRIISVIALVD
ncbi:TIGR01177 family methyltransferase [uncultured Methanobrevibacter sp.]|uniref:TIGR01177 family methyltransferase n=1 Tax=uncultured Methanobrevibacter sp. TaxID=253161 RepID=UPI0025E17A46|nr:TIGR01177 family methyltransferase [uncultured Methanobrevibacter sp.]